MSGELQVHGQQLVGRRMARACAEILGEHLEHERARRMEFPLGHARVVVEELEDPVARVARIYRRKKLKYIDVEVVE